MRVLISPSEFFGSVTAPPSKSEGHRCLISAALSDRTVTIKNLGESNDMTATITALKALGADIKRDGLTVTVSPIKHNNKNLTINFLESGSTARFLIPVVAALGCENITFIGQGRLPERPFVTIADVLRKNGVECSSDSLPMTVSGQLKAGIFELPGDISSQYISGLLFALSIIEGESEIVVTTPLQSKDYVLMTINELKTFGAQIEMSKNRFKIQGQASLKAVNRTVEGDWSQAAFHLVAGAVGGEVTVNGVDMNSLQGDKAIVDLLCRFGAEVTVNNNSVTVKKAHLKGIKIDASQIPDLVPILAVCAALSSGETIIYNAERLRIKESDRLYETALRLKAFGINAEATANGLKIFGGVPKSADITSANDHRIVMAFSILAGLSKGNSSISGAESINKSYPLFFKDYSTLGGECNVICDRQ